VSIIKGLKGIVWYVFLNSIAASVMLNRYKSQ